MKGKFTIGDKAPNFNVHSPWSKGNYTFKERKSTNTSVLFFLRYYGCLICQLDIKKIRDELSTFDQNDLDVYLIIQSTSETILEKTNQSDWPFTIICDPNAKIYEAFGVIEGNILQFLHPSGLPKVVQSLRLGNKHGQFEGKETQLPAVFGINAMNQIIYAHYGKHISDLPDFKTIIKSL